MIEQREPPHNFEAEQALLGAILFNNAAYHLVAEVLQPQHFADPLHGVLFDTVATLINRGSVVTALTLKPYIENNEAIRVVGADIYLARLLRSSTTASDAPTHANLIRDMYIRRQIIDLGERATTLAHSRDASQGGLQQIELLEQELYELASAGAIEGDARWFHEVSQDTLLQFEAAYMRSGALSGVTTGLRGLDQILGGLRKSDLIILAGRPSMGKTALAANIALNAAKAYSTEIGEDGGETVTAGATVAFYTLEMSDTQLNARIIAEQANVAGQRAAKGEINSTEFDKLMTVTSEMRPRLLMDDTSVLSISALRTRARRLKRKHGLGLIVIDYLQLLSGSGRSKQENRVQEVSEITRGLKALAKELDVPVLALAQLSRQVEQRDNKRPMLSDLRESGSIEQDADVVMFVYREEYYLSKQDEEKDTEKYIAAMGKAELIVAKHRHGPTGTVHLAFDGSRTKFSDLDGAAADDGGGIPQ
jgi:replicative DNA helicase